ncbi:hypothetical protein TEA_024379 [Camellia sinensis var. sinensis]|uniref:Uncharacterized protein n=1 Tax=Camellia sinensis var. sinensis TaxID=542762 RepID=A0A4S4D0Y6_CAMSN|nr:hypothetical protein TEA_024379 [Camellia sinensis var. sinensis]
MSTVSTMLCVFIILRMRDGQTHSSDSANAGTVQDDDEKEILDISAKSAIVFVITASIFLVLLYLFMSSWFVWLLIVLFCIGGTEGMHACIVSLVLSKWRNCGQKKVNLPLFGEISVLSLVVLLFCLVFSILWAAKREASYSWVGQDILKQFIHQICFRPNRPNLCQLDDCPDDCWMTGFTLIYAVIILSFERLA